MEKTGEVKPGVTPEVRPTEKCACACRCRKPVTEKERIKQLEEDAVARLAKKVSDQ